MKVFWRRFIAGILITGILLIGLDGFFLYRAAVHLGKAVGQQDQTAAQVSLRQFQQWWQPIHRVLSWFPSNSLLRWRAADEMVGNLPVLLGFQSARHYIVLFQNNMELRPTGGFMGSYADMWFEHGVMRSLLIQDIYVPDGQIKGYVKEPEAIKKYLFNNNHPGWRLRDANWNPDFPETVKALTWFFQEGELPPVNGFAAINLLPITDILAITGPITLTDYPDVALTSQSFYQEAQRHAEEGFFPGSTQKQDFLGSVGKTLLEQLTYRPQLWVKVLPIILTHLQQKNIFMVVPDIVSPAWHTLGWDGSLRDSPADYVMINEANVGMTKANCCVDRLLSDTVTIANQTASHRLELTYINNNNPVPQPPQTWGGGYKDFLRIIASGSAVLDSVTVNGIAIPSDQIITETLGNKTAFGFLVLTEGKQQSQVVVSYHLPWTQPQYALFVQKQSGIATLPFTVKIKNGNRISSQAKPMTTDWLFSGR